MKRIIVATLFSLNISLTNPVTLTNGVSVNSFLCMTVWSDLNELSFKRDPKIILINLLISCRDILSDGSSSELDQKSKAIIKELCLEKLYEKNEDDFCNIVVSSIKQTSSGCQLVNPIKSF